MIHSNESAENYLETILVLSKTLPVVRSVDIANELNFKKSSVSVAMKKLRESEHITVTPQGYIYLTETGKEVANKIFSDIYCSLHGWNDWAFLRKLLLKTHAVWNMLSAPKALKL